MTQNDQPDHDQATAFEAERPRLRSIATRMLGSVDEADDVVQEAWLRLDRTDDAIDNLPGWLTTVTSRLCLDHLRRRTARPEATWSEDAAEGWASDAPTPAEEVELADTVGRAMSVVLESLVPAERLAYVLHDVFAVPFGQVASILGRSDVATRQLASRARRRLEQPEVEDAPADRHVVDAFLKASRGNDFDALLDLLDPDAVVRSDADAAAMGSPALVSGGRSVTEFFAGRARAALAREFDGRPAAVWQHRGEVKVVFAFSIVDGRIVEIELLAAPAVLSRLS